MIEELENKKIKYNEMLEALQDVSIKGKKDLINQIMVKLINIENDLEILKQQQ